MINNFHSNKASFCQFKTFNVQTYKYCIFGWLYTVETLGYYFYITNKAQVGMFFPAKLNCFSCGGSGNNRL